LWFEIDKCDEDLIVLVALIGFMVWVWQQNDANLQTSYVMAKDTGLGKIIY
jgi:hypothetical protein